MKKLLIISALIAASFGAHAADTLNGNVTAGVTGTNAATVAPQNIGNPNIVFQGAQAPSPVTAARVDYSGQPVMSAAPVYVNSPAPATCDGAGFAASLQLVGAGGAVSNGGSERETCNTREDAKTLKFVGASQDVIKSRLCQSKTMAQAFADAGSPCTVAKVAGASGVSGSAGGVAAPVLTSPASTVEPRDPFVRQRMGLPPL